MSEASHVKKTVMLLGGSRHQVPAIECAKRLGYRTVLCDYLPDNPGQYVADVFYQESTTDRELMLEIARREHIDGILSFGSDVAAPTASYVAEVLGLPCNPLKSVEILSEKNLFRPYMSSHGFNCPKSCSFAADSSAEEVVAAVEDMTLPMLLKPTDSSGSRGVSVLNDLSFPAVENALEFAREFSRNGVLELEEFIKYGFPYLVGGDIFVAEGEVKFWGLMRCLRDKDLAALVPAGKAYPSGLASKQIELLKAEVQKLVSSLNLSFGEMNLEVIMGPGDVPFIVELGARAGGNMIPLQLQDISGIDLTEALVRYTVGEGPVDVSFDGGENCVTTIVLHARQTGRFERVEYDEKIASHIYRELVYVSPGDHVEEFNYGAKALGVVFLKFESQAEMDAVLPEISKYVRVVVKEGI